MSTKVTVILSKDLKKVGFAGDLVEVASGYARNFLFPKRFAVEATPVEMKKAQIMNAQKLRSKEEMKAKAAEIIKTLEMTTLTFIEKVSKENHLYGSIAEKNIAEKLKEEARFDVEKNQVEMPNGHIKTIGNHTVVLHLFEGKTVTLKIEVKALEEEKKGA